MSNSDDSFTDEVAELFGRDVRLKLLREAELDDSRIAVVELTVESSNTGTSSTRQTAVILDDSNLHLPQFFLQPRASNLLGTLSGKLLNIAQIEFPDTPQFSKAYQVQAWSEPPVRVLFTAEVRAVLSEKTGWSVRGKGSKLVIFRPSQIIKEPELDKFVEQALEILHCFQLGEEELDARPEIRRDVTPEDMVKSAANAGGLAGALLARQLAKIAVSPEELDRFLASNTPRNIPPGIYRQIVGETLSIGIAGIVVAMVGIIGSAIWFVMAEGTMKLLGIPLLLFTLGGGGLMAWLALGSRSKNLRTLRQGRIIAGQVTEVKRTSVEINNRRRYHVTVKYEIDGQSKTVRTNQYGGAVDQAKAFMDSGGSVRLLVDPANEDFVLCADFVVLFSNT